MNKYEAARMIDISAVRTAHSLADVEEVVAIARKYRFINVHALPCWVKTLSEMLKGDEDIFVGAPVGFPSGAHRFETKMLEAMLLIQDGVQEMDIVMNVGRFKNKEYDYVLDELKTIIGMAQGKVLTKVIIELNALTEYEADKACELVMESGANFLKTGTGWIPGDANVERIRRIKQLTDGIIKVKAAGGIRTRAEFDALVDMGVERFGINTRSALDIVSSFDD